MVLDVMLLMINKPSLYCAIILHFSVVEILLLLLKIYPVIYKVCVLQSDPMLVAYTKRRDGVLEELGRTEVILNSLNPTWTAKHTITYHFEIVQTLV